MVIKQLVLFLALSAVALGAIAKRLPFYYPEEFPRTGLVERLDVVKRLVVINDTVYFLSDRMTIHSIRSEFDTLDKMGKGAQIGFKVMGAGSGRPIITEAWVLPASMRR